MRAFGRSEKSWQRFCVLPGRASILAIRLHYNQFVEDCEGVPDSAIVIHNEFE